MHVCRVTFLEIAEQMTAAPQMHTENRSEKWFHPSVCSLVNQWICWVSSGSINDSESAISLISPNAAWVVTQESCITRTSGQIFRKSHKQSFFLFQTVFPDYVTTGRGYVNPVTSEACMSHLLPESYAPPSSLQEGVCQFGGNSSTTVVTLLEGDSSLLPFNGQNNALWILIWKINGVDVCIMKWHEEPAASSDLSSSPSSGIKKMEASCQISTGSTCHHPFSLVSFGISNTSHL